MKSAQLSLYTDTTLVQVLARHIELYTIIHRRMLLSTVGGVTCTSGAKKNARSPARRTKPRSENVDTSQQAGCVLRHTIQTQASVTNVPAQTALSPIASKSSSASYIPKSSSSTGPISGQSPLDYNIYDPGDQRKLYSLTDIDERLDAINA